MAAIMDHAGSSCVSSRIEGYNTMSDTKYKPQETVADFRERITRMVRERETGKKYSIIGAARPSPCLLRPKYGVAGPGREYEANPDPRYNAAVFAMIRSDVENALENS